MANIFSKKDNNFDSARLDLIKNIKDDELKFFLQNHHTRIEDLYDFFRSSEKIIALCGFQASGKDKIIKSSLSFLSKDICKIILDCSTSICLDDIMLFIHNRLKIFCENNKIFIKKASSQDFAQMLKETLSQLNFPIILVLNSFEHCLEEENKKEIIDFLKFLQNFKNIKIILSARKLNNELEELNIKKYISKALEIDATQKYFQNNDLTITKNHLEKFYEYSRGYYGYVVITANILKSLSLTIEDFLQEFEEKNITFDDFLINKILSFISDNARNILEFLAILRVNFPIKTILSLNFATEEEIDYLIKKNIVSVFENSLYIKDFIKNAILKDTKIYTQYKFHKFMIDFFDSQLPLKPKERYLELSRYTMRKEIKYHTQFVNSNNSTKPSKSRLPHSVANMSYISYSRGLKDKLAPDLIETMEQVTFDKSKIVESNDGTIYEFDSTEIPNILNRIDLSLLKSKKSIKTEEIKEKTQFEEIKNTKQEIDITEALNSAENQQKQENYTHSNKILFDLINSTNDDNVLLDAYIKIAQNYKFLNDFMNSIEYNELALNLMEKMKNKEQADLLSIEIADLYKDSYKTDKAKNLYFQILAESNLTPYIITKCNLGLAETEDKNTKFIYDCFQKVFDNLNLLQDNSLKAEAYFKFALLKDDEGKLNEALNFYKKSIETSNDKNNLFLSSCYSNIGSIYIDMKDINSAIQNFDKALIIDKENNNYEGIYYCHSQLAELLESKNKNDAKNHYILAIKSAKSLNDKFYIANAYLKFGDFCTKYADAKIAIKQYIIAKNYINNETNNENLIKINSRLEDFKIKLGKDKYLQIIRDLKNNE